MEYTDQIYMVQTNGRVIVTYTDTKQDETNNNNKKLSPLQEKQTEIR